MARLTSRCRVSRFTAEGADGPHHADLVIVEEPLEIRIDGIPFQVTMRTPGHDIDLVHGLLLAEGVISGRLDVSSARYCAGTGPDGLNTYNVLDISLADGVAAPDPGLSRNVLTTSACGVCGTQSVETVLARTERLTARTTIPAARIIAAIEALPRSQELFARTGGVHAVGLIDGSGSPVCVREDVGRHNAADKVVGWAVREERLPLTGHVMVVSARASFELVHKAVVAGAEVLAAVSAPTSLAIELAEEAGLTLAGFVRGGVMNVYTHADRLV